VPEATKRVAPEAMDKEANTPIPNEPPDVIRVVPDPEKVNEPDPWMLIIGVLEADVDDKVMLVPPLMTVDPVMYI